MFSVASKFPKPAEPIRRLTTQRGPAPIPPKGAIRMANTMGVGDNPANTGAALQANLNHSTSTNHNKTGNVFRTVSYRVFDMMSSDLASLFTFTDPNQMLVDFSFCENFNNALQVEEKKNQQNRFVASREPPPVPTLPPRKASFPPTNPLPPTPVQKDKPVQAKSSSAVTNSKPE